jgi:uncharacterized membrane protein
MNTKTLNRIIFILAIFGICTASYVAFTWLTGSPIVCITGGCETVRKNPVAWPFGIPFPLIGLVGYLFIAIMSFLKTLNKNWEKGINKAILGFAGFGVCLVSYFTFLETFVIKGYCMWCIFSAINMLVIFLLSIKIYKFKNQV